MLRYTGHPVVDVGVATAAAFAEKPAPEQLTVEDLRRLAAYLLDVYLRDALRPYLSCVYTMNSPYLQASWTRERRRAEAEKVLFAFDAAPDPAVAGLRCVFSGEPATRMAYRHHVPMLTGEGVFNFAPAGLGGLPVAGSFLLAIQAFALGARRCHGRALAVHSPDDPELTYAFAQRFLQENRRIILLASEEGGNYLDAKAPRTLIIHTLLEIEEERRTSLGNGPAPSLTVYHLTNSGQGPDIDIFQLPSQTVAFLRAASGAGTARAWHSIQMAAWERPEPTRPRRGRATAGGPAPEAAPTKQAAPDSRLAPRHPGSAGPTVESPAPADPPAVASASPRPSVPIERRAVPASPRARTQRAGAARVAVRAPERLDRTPRRERREASASDEPAVAAPAPTPAAAAAAPAPALPAPQPAARTLEEIVVPADTVIGLQMTTAVSSETAKLEDAVEARVARDVEVGGRVAIPAGSRLLGSVVLVDRGGKIRERARLGIRFHTIALPDGASVPLETEAIYREGESPARESAGKIGAAAVGGATGRALVAVIGPVTAEAARRHGIRVDVEAAEHTMPGLVQALCERLAAEPLRSAGV